jgi:UDP-N-acetylmuramyl pentapeptide synthase
MSDYLYAIASLGFLLWIVRNTIFWGELLQQKGFSFKRTKRYLTKSYAGRKIISSPFSLLKWLAIFLYPVIIFAERYAFIYHVGIALLYSGEIVIVIKDIVDGTIFRKKYISLKTFFIIFFTLLFGVLFFFYPPLDKFIWLILIDRFIVFIVLLGVIICALPEELYWDYKSVIARRKLKKFPKLNTILLVGDDETELIRVLLVQILSAHFSVLTTESRDKKGVIKTVLTRMKPEHQLFIITGTQDEFLDIASFLKPRYLVISSPDAYNRPENAQGTLDVLTKHSAKNGRLLVLKDPAMPLPLSKRARKAIRFYHTNDTAGNSPDYTTRSNILRKKKTGFVAVTPKKSFQVGTSLISEGASFYILPVIALLFEIGLSTRAIREGITNAQSENILKYSEKNCIVLINNSGETAGERLRFLFSYISFYRKKKILIWDVSSQPETNQREQEALAGEVMQRFDYIFLIGTHAISQVLKRMGDKEQTCFVSTASRTKVAYFLTSLAAKGDAVVFHGTEAGSVYKLFIEAL